jgi:acyl dehydratase
MDAEWCRGQPFGERIAHGTLVFAVAVGLTAGEINPLAMTYGYDALRFVKPVKIGDTIRSTVAIAALREHRRPTHGLVVERLEARNQCGAVVMACDHLLLVQRRVEAAVAAT